MREIRPSGSEGGARSIPCPYPYRGFWELATAGSVELGDPVIALAVSRSKIILDGVRVFVVVY